MPTGVQMYDTALRGVTLRAEEQPTMAMEVGGKKGGAMASMNVVPLI